jgi:hypothetical protein
VGLTIASAGWGVVTTAHFGPVYYNLIGQQMAGRWLESSYWGEGITPQLLNRTLDGPSADRTITISPILHQFQLLDLAQQYQPWLPDQPALIPYSAATGEPATIIVSMRLADLPKELWSAPPGYELIAETIAQGRPLARCYRKVDPSSLPTER